MNINTQKQSGGRKHLYFLFPFLISMMAVQLPTASAQSTNTTPCAALPFCSDSAYVFPNNTTGSAPAGLNYACDLTQPNPSFYYMQIGTAGTIQLTMVQTSASNQQLDVDFAMWGPFPDLATGCAAVMAGAVPIQSSYSPSYTETIGIGLPGGVGIGVGCATTPPPAQVGEVYIVLMTNFSQQPGNISFSQTGGTGSADCGIVCGLHTTTDSVACAGTPFNIGAYNSNDTEYTYTYLWTGPFGLTSTAQNPTFSIDQAGTYSFDVRSISNTDDTCFQTADIVILPTDLTQINVALCQGETYNFFGKEYYATGVYDSLFTNTSGCDSVVRLNLTVNPLPDVTIKGFKDLEICDGDSVRVALETPEASSTYQWLKDGSAIAGATYPEIMLHDAGDYRVKATTDKGCTAISDNIKVRVRPNPVAAIAPFDNEIICAYDTAQLSAVTGPNYDYRWTPEKPFRAVTGPEGQTVRGVFLEPATLVVLTVNNEFGCHDSASVMINTKPCCEVFVPSAFTPNGDGSNDYFKPQLQPGQILTWMKVFNRLGQLVYDNKAPDKGWDGNFENGQPAPIDTYMYYIEYTCADGKIYHKKESLTLVR